MGYTLTVRLNQNGGNDATNLKTFLETSIKDIALTEEHNGELTYKIATGAQSWSSLFTIMEKARAQVNAGDYSINETSLEQGII